MGLRPALRRRQVVIMNGGIARSSTRHRRWPSRRPTTTSRHGGRAPPTPHIRPGRCGRPVRHQRSAAVVSHRGGPDPDVAIADERQEVTPGREDGGACAVRRGHRAHRRHPAGGSAPRECEGAPDLASSVLLPVPDDQAAEVTPSVVTRRRSRSRCCAGVSSSSLSAPRAGARSSWRVPVSRSCHHSDLTRVPPGSCR